MKHFEKAGMKPDLNAHSNCCQNPAAWQGWSTKSASKHSAGVDQSFGIVFSRQELSSYLFLPCTDAAVLCSSRASYPANPKYSLILLNWLQLWETAGKILNVLTSVVQYIMKK